MPRVPAIPQTVVTENVAAAPIRAPLQSVQGAGVDSSGLARGIMSGAEAIERSNLQLSQIRLSEAETEVINRWNSRLHTDDDAYYKLRGKESVDALDGRMKELQDIQNDVSDRLQTGTEKRIFNTAMNGRHQQNRVKMATKSFDERQQWDKTTAIANIQAQLESASTDSSIENLTITKARIQEEAASVARIEGLPPEEQARAAGVAVSGMYRSAIETTLINDLDHAQNLFDKFDSEIISSDRKAISKALNEQTIASASRSLAIEARDHSDSAEEQLKFIKRKLGKNPSARQTEIVERASQKAITARSQIEGAQSVARSENFNFLGERVIAATQGGSRGVEIIESLQAAFPERFEGEVLNTSQRSQLQNLANVGQPNETTSEGMMTYLRIMELAATNPNVLAELDPADYLGSMGSKEFDRVAKAINGAKGAGITGETAALGSRQKTLNDNAERHGFDLSKSELSGAGLLIQRESIARLDEFVATQKRQPTEREWLDIVDGLFVKVLLDDPRPPIDTTSVFAVPQAFVRSFGGVDKQFAFTLQIDDIPAIQRKVVSADFRSKNNGRNPRPNELETHFISLMNDPVTRSILLGK